MKTTLLLIASLILFTFSSVAQPEVTLEDFTPEYGTQIGHRSTGFVDQGPGGENLFWDFSDLPNSDSIIYTVVDPDTQINASMYTNSTHHYDISTCCDENYYVRYADDTVQIIGFDGVPPPPVTYANYETILVFPLTYLSSFSDESQYLVGDVSFYGQSEIYEASVDAYGTLVLPTGTFENVLRVKFEVTLSETFAGGQTSSTEEFAVTRWMYVSSEVPQPLATFSQKLDSTNAVVSSGGEIYDPAIFPSVEEKESGQFSFSVFPSPADEFVNVSVEAEKVMKVRIELKSAVGRTVAEFGERQLSRANNEVSLQLPELSSGIYFLQMTGKGGSVVERIVIK